MQKAIRTTLVAAAIGGGIVSAGCRSGSGMNLFARKGPSAEALAGTGPSTTYPAPPSGSATPQAIASIAGGTSSGNPNSTPSMMPGVSPGSLPGMSPGSSLGTSYAAAAANGISGQTVGYRNGPAPSYGGGPPKNLAGPPSNPGIKPPSGYGFGGSPNTPAVATNNPGPSNPGLNTPDPSGSGSTVMANNDPQSSGSAPVGMTFPPIGQAMNSIAPPKTTTSLPPGLMTGSGSADSGAADTGQSMGMSLPSSLIPTGPTNSSTTASSQPAAANPSVQTAGLPGSEDASAVMTTSGFSPGSIGTASGSYPGTATPPSSNRGSFYR